MSTAHVTVQIVDASIADSLAPVLAQTHFESAAQGQREILFAIDLPDLEHRGRDIRIVARVMRLPGDQVAARDYLTMESVQIGPDARADDWIEVPVRKVDDPGA